MQRDPVLDLVKGLCVLAMVVHHSLNYFPVPGLGVKYVHFVSGAFPFLAGFIVTHVSAVKYQEADQNRRMGLRLLFRGVRLLALCGVINALLTLAMGRSAKLGFTNPWDYLAVLYLEGTNREVFFSLLIPIGYVIAALGLLQLVRLLHLLPVGLAAMMLFAYGCWSEHIGESAYYYTYFAVGMIGALLGFVPFERLRHAAGTAWIVLAIYAPSLGAIMLFHQPFPLYAFSVAATLLLLYALSTRLPLDTWYSRHLLLWGRYSLILYLSQICLLFFLRFVWHKFAVPDVAALMPAGVVTCILQSVLCFLFDRLRKDLPVFDRSYRLFFA
jgi:hypothetical protein